MCLLAQAANARLHNQTRYMGLFASFFILSCFDCRQFRESLGKRVDAIPFQVIVTSCSVMTLDRKFVRSVPTMNPLSGQCDCHLRFIHANNANFLYLYRQRPMNV